MEEGGAEGWRGGWQRSRHSHKASAPRGVTECTRPAPPAPGSCKGWRSPWPGCAQNSPSKAWLVLSYHLLLPWPKHITHLFVHTPGTWLLHWDATSLPFLGLHPEHLPPMSRALCSKVTGCSLIQFRMQLGQLLGFQPLRTCQGATMNTVISISHPPGAELCRDGAMQLWAGGKQEPGCAGKSAWHLAGHSPLLFTLAWAWPR